MRQSQSIFNFHAEAKCTGGLPCFSMLLSHLICSGGFTCSSELVGSLPLSRQNFSPGPVQGGRGVFEFGASTPAWTNLWSRRYEGLIKLEVELEKQEKWERGEKTRISQQELLLVFMKSFTISTVEVFYNLANLAKDVFQQTYGTAMLKTPCAPRPGTAAGTHVGRLKDQPQSRSVHLDSQLGLKES